MEREEFVRIRKFLNKTQKQFSELLGVSVKAIQGYEQGWRSIPGHIERLSYLLVQKRFAPKSNSAPCWDIMSCPEKQRNGCPAWEFSSGDMCWLVCGTICGGVPQDNWESKMKQCRQCPILRAVIDSIP